MQYDIQKVVFGSSSNLEDHRHMNRLKAQHGVRKSRTVTVSTVEEMFALVSSAPHVITDRYHPGVASMIVGTKLSITKYVLEATKVTLEEEFEPSFQLPLIPSSHQCKDKSHTNTI